MTTPEELRAMDYIIASLSVKAIVMRMNSKWFRRVFDAWCEQKSIEDDGH